jgi:E3 ubiquitin-protein ligase HUWE1
MPNLLNFENKRAYFKREIEKMKREAEADHDSISISVKRNDIFMTAYNHLNYRRGDIKKRIRVQYEGEEGADAGGVMRDFYIELSRQMFNPNYSLYTLTDNGVSHYFNTQSYINPDHLSFIKFTGRMVGKALFDGQYMDCYFAKPLYKMILGEDLTFKDLEDLDNDLFKNLAWGIENDLTELE